MAEEGKKEEKTLLITTYEINVVGREDEYLIFTSASWCAPCSRIKPHVQQHVEDGYLRPISEREIPKSEAEPGLIIPYFLRVTDKGEVISGLQTSSVKDLDTLIGLKA